MKRLKRNKPARRPSRLAIVQDSTAHAVAHESSDSIRRNLGLLDFQRQVVDEEIQELQATLADKKRMRAELEAAIAGMAAVVNKR
jgi:hypothetical protein